MDKNKQSKKPMQPMGGNKDDHEMTLEEMNRCHDEMMKENEKQKGDKKKGKG